MTRRPLLARELDMLGEIIAEEVNRFLGGAPKRRRLACGRTFTPRHSWHFLCCESCRSLWNRGRIRPRRGNR